MEGEEKINEFGDNEARVPVRGWNIRWEARRRCKLAAQLTDGVVASLGTYLRTTHAPSRIKGEVFSVTINEGESVQGARIVVRWNPNHRQCNGLISNGPPREHSPNGPYLNGEVTTTPGIVED